MTRQNGAKKISEDRRAGGCRRAFNRLWTSGRKTSRWRAVRHTACFHRVCFARARLMPGCCAYSFNTYLSKKKMTYPEFFDKVVEMGSVGADMTVYWFESTDPAYLDDLRHLAFRKGIPFSGAACGASMVQASAAKRREVLADIKKWVDVTDQFGASHLRIFGGPLPKGVT